MRYLLLCLLMLLGVFAVSAQSEIDGMLTFGGYERPYVVHVPAIYTGDTPVPLVIGLHGGGGTARSFARTSELSAAADERGFIVAYPNGIGGGWNDGRRAILQRAYREGVDDVGFLAALIDVLTAEYNIDRVYMAGHSNGGMMIYRFACEMADWLDGFMAVAANMPDAIYEDCAPSRPIPALIVVGDADRIVPFAGGTVGQGSRRGDYGIVMSAADTLTVWTNANGCAGEGVETALPDSADDGARVFLTAFDDCAAPVHFYRVEKGGHAYPGDMGRPTLDAGGIVTHDIRATDLFLEFFGL